jgi:hypothetical protein
VETVERTVRSHSSPNRTSLSTAAIVFRNINHKTEVEAQDLAEVEVLDLTEDHEKCTKRPVETVERTVRSHSSPNRTSLSTAAIVFKVIKETRKYSRIMDRINPIRTYYVATIVLVIATIVFFILKF